MVLFRGYNETSLIAFVSQVLYQQLFLLIKLDYLFF